MFINKKDKSPLAVALLFFNETFPVAYFQKGREITRTQKICLLYVGDDSFKINTECCVALFFNFCNHSLTALWSQTSYSQCLFLLSIGLFIELQTWQRRDQPWTTHLIKGCDNMKARKDSVPGSRGSWKPTSVQSGARPSVMVFIHTLLC